ncbi:MAG: dipeptide/oligopeptide/nickel ABC transporter ATP-binding protein [Treponema sp.]|nr:dipeptide/oligopeptide/nickel ABC transporter ATP-binding protein [Treponema sp.]
MINNPENKSLIVKDVSAYYSSRQFGLFGKKEIKHVLKSINLTINRGEIYGLIGESGCGKSTLARAILGLIPYEGDIIINGKIRGREPLFSEIQAVFQNSSASLNPVKNIGWILEEPLRVKRFGNALERQVKIDKTLELVGLNTSHKKRRPRELSSGQKQRVSIALALMNEPSIIIADEPTSALDVSVQAQILNLLRELNKNLKLSLLFISHNLDIVNYLCDRISFMQDGKLIET